jgi:hypothetical protein
LCCAGKTASSVVSTVILTFERLSLGEAFFVSSPLVLLRL